MSVNRSILDKNKTYNQDQWLFSVAYKENTGPIILLESEKDNQAQALAYTGKLADDGKSWRLEENKAETINFEGAYYSSFPLSEPEDKEELLQDIEGAMKEIFDFDQEQPNPAMMFSLNNTQPLQDLRSNQLQKMYKDYYQGIIDDFDYLVVRHLDSDDRSFDESLPKTIEGFKKEADRMPVSAPANRATA